MKIFDHLTIKLRLIFMVVSTCALIIVIGILWLNGLNSVEAMDEMHEKRIGSKWRTGRDRWPYARQPHPDVAGVAA